MGTLFQEHDFELNQPTAKTITDKIKAKCKTDVLRFRNKRQAVQGQGEPENVTTPQYAPPEAGSTSAPGSLLRDIEHYSLYPVEQPKRLDDEPAQRKEATPKEPRLIEPAKRTFTPATIYRENRWGFVREVPTTITLLHKYTKD